MTLDELEAELSQKELPPPNIPKYAFESGSTLYGLYCIKCKTQWAASYLAKCLVCSAPKEDVRLRWQKPTLPDETTALKADIPAEKVKNGMGAIEYLLHMQAATAMELTSLKKNKPEAFLSLIHMAKAEMKAKGIKVTGSFADPEETQLP